LPAGTGYHYLALLHHGTDQPMLLTSGRFESSPFISFRWLKGAGEVYGRSPVMTVLPDIKTVNKVVELVLKNASISVTGIWQADDDGVLNPANIQLVPGSIIPKAVGSAGLTPLQAPGRFDVSSLMLEDLRSRIRHALLVDRLGAIGSRKMTATEVLERSTEMTRLLGATYGRLQAELLSPLLSRAMAILRRRGEIPDLALDGRLVDLRHKSPLARLQAQKDVQSTLLWLETTAKMGAEAVAAVDLPATARWLGDRLGVPGQLIRDIQLPTEPLQLTEALIEAKELQGMDSADGR
jgi:Bacteriophage head to tail connecting protein